MTQEDMRTKFADLYELMASSHDVNNMRVFGNVHKEMMEWMIQNKPDMASDLIEKLGSIRWHNYLTTKEAEKIVGTMVPKAPWSREMWRQAMEGLGIPTEEEWCYNRCALWVVMNMIYSDSANTIANIMGMPLQDVPAEQIIRSVHALALDKLKDADKWFNVRNYFGV